MARLAGDSDSALSLPRKLDRLPTAKVPLKPTTDNLPRTSPHKNTADVKDDTWGDAGWDYEKKSPAKISASPVRSRVAGTGRQQRSLKIPKTNSLLVAGAISLPPMEGNVIKEPSETIRESPTRRAKRNRIYDMGDYGSESEAELDNGHDYVPPWKSSSKTHDRKDETPLVPAAQSQQEERVVADLENLSLRNLELSSPRKKQQEVVDLTGSPTKTKILGTLSSPSKKILQIDRRCSPTSSSSDNDAFGATLRFSPPLHRSPAKRPPMNSTIQRPQTPPASPTKSRLTSPSKRPPTLPTAPPTHHRPSLDAFWDQAEINTWTDTHSPKKILASPRKPRSYSWGSSDAESPVLSTTTSPRNPTDVTSPSKKQAAARAKKIFDTQKQRMAESFFNEIDGRLTKGEVAKLAESGGGVKIVWSKKLNSTAGRANWRREAHRRIDASSKSSATVEYRHIASIELAEKVIDDEKRLNNVLAHEFCHLANFMISRELKNPHGSSFKSWASKATAALYKSHGVEVTTKHDYVIKYKYLWVCSSPSRSDQGADDGCGTEYARHSKSIDPTRHTCGKCRGRLVQVRPKPRATAARVGDDTALSKDPAGIRTTGAGTEYQRFVKEHFQAVRSDLPPGSPMKDVMREVGSRYRLGKQQKKEGEKIIEAIEIADDETTEEVADGSSDAEVKGGEDVENVARVLDFLTISGR